MALCNGDTKVSAAGASRSPGPGQPGVAPPPPTDGLCWTVEGKVGRAGSVPTVPLSTSVAVPVAALRERV